MRNRVRALTLAFVAAAPSALAFAADGDLDGVEDHADGYPCDPAATAIAFAPAEGQFGLLQFEDQWPLEGDLDFNDVQLAWNYVARLRPDGRVLSVRATFNVLALGGTFDNGLALHLPVPAAGVQSVTRQVGAGPVEALAVSTADAELHVDVSNNLRELFGYVADQINSQGTAVAGEALEVVITFSAPPALDLGRAPFDPYIFRTQQRGLEIHRTEFAGSAVMDTALFGTGDDASTAQRSFVTHAGLPFVLDLPELAPYPAEATDIANLFPLISSWAASGGAVDADFYRRSVDLAYEYPNPLTPIFGGSTSDADTSCVVPGQDPAAAGTSCAALMAQGANQSGAYWLDGDGSGPAAPFLAYCDFTTAGGGWTLALSVPNGRPSSWRSLDLVRADWNASAPSPSVAHSVLHSLNASKLHTTDVMIDGYSGANRHLELGCHDAIQVLFYAPLGVGYDNSTLPSGWDGNYANIPECNNRLIAFRGGFMFTTKTRHMSYERPYGFSSPDVYWTAQDGFALVDVSITEGYYLGRRLNVGSILGANGTNRFCPGQVWNGSDHYNDYDYEGGHTAPSVRVWVR